MAGAGGIVRVAADPSAGGRRRSVALPRPAAGRAGWRVLGRAARLFLLPEPVGFAASGTYDRHQLARTAGSVAGAVGRRNPAGTGDREVCGGAAGSLSGRGG